MTSTPVTFLWPQFLWLLLALPLLVLLYWWLMRRRKQTALRYANLSIVREALGKGPGWRRHVPPMLLLLALAMGAALGPAHLRQCEAPRALAVLARLHPGKADRAFGHTGRVLPGGDEQRGEPVGDPRRVLVIGAPVDCHVAVPQRDRVGHVGGPLRQFTGVAPPCTIAAADAVVVEQSGDVVRLNQIHQPVGDVAVHVTHTPVAQGRIVFCGLQPVRRGL